jgi:hypothetical protein
LQGPHHVNDLRRFLHNHYLAGNEVEAIYNMLLAQAINQARFRPPSFQVPPHLHSTYTALTKQNRHMAGCITC